MTGKRCSVSANGKCDMIVKKIRFTVLSPINYYYIQAGRGLRTSQFIGDIALKYSLLHGLGLHDFPIPGKSKPTYEELKEFNFWFTVAMPPFYSLGEGSSEPVLMHPIYRNTMQGIDYNGSNSHPKIRTGSIMYKNFYFQQYIKPGNHFYSFFLSDEKIELPEALRVGTGKVGLVLLEEMPSSFDLNGYLNLYTIQNVLGKKEEAKHILEDNLPFYEHVALPYFVVGPLTEKSLGDIYYGEHSP